MTPNPRWHARLLRVRAIEQQIAAGKLAEADRTLSAMLGTVNRLDRLRRTTSAAIGATDGARLHRAGEMVERLDAARQALEHSHARMREEHKQAQMDQRRAKARSDATSDMISRHRYTSERAADDRAATRVPRQQRRKTDREDHR